MSVNEFLELLVKEFELNRELTGYYKLLKSKSAFLFRKSYLEQRLRYIDKSLNDTNELIWDAGCGYATSSIFLSLNGYKVTGTTLEYYYDKIRSRLDYWSKYGNVDSLNIKYENLFDNESDTGSYDTIILQDTLHHLEPIYGAMKIFRKVLKDNGRIIVSEENGNNIIRNIKLFRERGFKRITEVYDEKLNKKIMFGNENTRSMRNWEKIFCSNNFIIDANLTEYIRFFPPALFNEINYYNIIDREQRIWKRNKILREFFFFGINFIAVKSSEK